MQDITDRELYAFLLGVAAVVVVVPSLTWLTLRISNDARLFATNKIAGTVDERVAVFRNSLSPEIVIPLVGVDAVVHGITGMTLAQLIHKEVSVKVGNTALQYFHLPPAEGT